MLLPGPEAQQLATYVGWLMHRTVGGIMAGGLFIVPEMTRGENHNGRYAQITED
jgi:chromate transport protein ChrA